MRYMNSVNWNWINRLTKEVADLRKVKRSNQYGKAWKEQDISRLRQLAEENSPSRVIGLKLGRTEDSIRSKASNEGLK